MGKHFRYWNKDPKNVPGISNIDFEKIPFCDVINFEYIFLYYLFFKNSKHFPWKQLFSLHAKHIFYPYYFIFILKVILNRKSCMKAKTFMLKHVSAKKMHFHLRQIYSSFCLFFNIYIYIYLFYAVLQVFILSFSSPIPVTTPWR